MHVTLNSQLAKDNIVEKENVQERRHFKAGGRGPKLRSQEH